MSMGQLGSPAPCCWKRWTRFVELDRLRWIYYALSVVDQSRLTSTSSWLSSGSSVRVFYTAYTFITGCVKIEQRWDVVHVKIE